MAQPDEWADFRVGGASAAVPSITTPASAAPLPSPPRAPKDPPAPKTTYRTLTPEEATARGLPAGKTYQESSEGKVDAVASVSEQGGGSKEAARSANLDSLVTQINRVQELYNSNLRDEAIPLLSALGDYLPTEGNKQFDTAAAGLAEQGLAAFRVPGVGAQSDTELRQFVDANKPSAKDFDASIEEKLRQLRIRVDANREAMGLPPAQWAGLTTEPTKREDDPAVAVGGVGSDRGGEPATSPSSPAAPTPPALSPGDPGFQAATGGTRRSADPALSKQIDAMVRSGASYAEVNALAKSQGADTIDPSQFAAVKDFLRKNPNYDGLLVDAWRTEPLSTFEQTVTDLGANPAGAYFLNAGQALSANTLDNLAADPERARAAMDIVSTENPTSSALGNVSGGVLGAMLGEAGLARLGVGAGLARGLGTDVAIGAAGGAGDADEGNRLTGALKGGVAQGLGSVAGTATTRGISNMISPTGGSVADLYAAGVRPTPGQRVANAGGGRGMKATVGRVINSVEEGLQSVPIVGSAIRGAREEARDQWQVGAFNQALSDIGEELPKGMRPGTDPHKFAQRAFDEVYEKARNGMRMVADEELKGDLASLAPDISTLGPEAQRKLKSILDNSVNSKLVDGELAGPKYKFAVSDLGKQIARYRKSAMADDQALADVLEGVQDALDNAARRHSPAEAVELLDAADAGYAKMVIIEDAARRRGGDDGTFSPTQLNAAAQNMSGGVRSRRFLRGEAPMQDYAQAGSGLVDRMPNSGTSDRAMIAGGIGAGGAAYLAPETLTILGAIGAAYAPGVRRVTKGALAPGGPRAKAIAQQLRKRAQLVGRATGATAALAAPASTPSQ